MTPMTDWDAWHQDYADPASTLSERLRVVQQHISDWLDESTPRPVTVLSACAGDGRDLLGVLEHRDDASRVMGLLLETDRRNAEHAAERARRLKLTGVTVEISDAGTTCAYQRAVPADLLLLCGIFGNVSDDDVHRTILAVPQLCAHDAVVIWTRHRQHPDLTPHIRRWFVDAGCKEEAFVAPEHAIYTVGVHRFRGEARTLDPDQRLFTFTR